MAVYALLLAVLACDKTGAGVRADVQAYLARARDWAAVEGATAATIRRILRTHFVDEAEVQRQIRDSRPGLERHLAIIRGYAPRTDEIRRIHERYVDAWQELLLGYEAIERGFASGEYRRLAAGRVAMSMWKDTIQEIAKDLRGLMREHRIDPNELRRAAIPAVPGRLGRRSGGPACPVG